MSGLSLTVSAVIGGFFGMTLKSGIEELPGLLWLVGFSGACTSAGLLYVLTAGVRRFHHSQRAHLLQMGSLQRGLESLDQVWHLPRSPPPPPMCMLLTAARLGSFERGLLCAAPPNPNPNPRAGVLRAAPHRHPHTRQRRGGGQRRGRRRCGQAAEGCQRRRRLMISL